MKRRYRSDIEGLRAFAVGTVIMFHYHINKHFSGGFVGVDIFFVISGYLITSILHQDIIKNNYSVTRFYDRRIRRIFPALFIIIIITILYSTIFLVPNDVHRISKNSILSVLFSTNLIYSRTGYFDNESDFNPLLHIWSLSVEEQFYIVFPLVLVLAERYTRRPQVWIGAVGLISLVASAWAVTRWPSADFYLVQYRAWELLIGGLLAMGAVPSLGGRMMTEAAGFLGLALIGWSVFTFDHATLFPGANALLPCLGAALIIYSGVERQTLTGRLLSFAPLRFVGAISYSLYLWHWPVLVLYRLSFGAPLTLPIKLMLILISVVGATLSWRFVERPFRERPFLIGSRTVLIRGGVAMAGIILFAVAAGPFAAARWTGPAEAEQALAYIDISTESSYRQGQCFLTSTSDSVAALDRQTCLKLASDRPNYLLIGDSHAAHLWSGLSQAYPAVNFLQATASGCKPVEPLAGADRCTQLLTWILTDFVPKHHLDGIVISANWNAADLLPLLSTVRSLKIQVPRVIVLGPIIQYDMPLPHLLSLSLMRHDPDIVVLHRLPATAMLDRTYAAGLAGSGAEYVSLYQALCRESACLTWAAPGVPLQSDDAHLTEAGSVLLASKLQLTFPD